MAKNANNNAKRNFENVRDMKPKSFGKKGKGKRKKVDSKGESAFPSAGGGWNHPTTRSCNDFSWYSRYPELLAAASRVAFPFRPGMHVDAGTYDVDQEGTEAKVKMPVPGIMRIEYAYTIGSTSEDVTSPASIAAQRLYANVRKNFSSDLSADAPDMLIYALALDQVHAYIAWLKRLYCTINSYSPDNHLFPVEMFKAEIAGLGSLNNPMALFLRDKIKFYGYINTLVNMANQFDVPMVMSIYERHRWMNQYVYSDNDSVRGQMYVFAPTGFFEIDDTAEFSTLKWVSVKADAIDWTDPVEWLFQTGRAMIDVLAKSEDAYTINGYIQRAFDGVPNYRSTLQLQDEILAPQPAHEEVLAQIHNLTVLDDFLQGRITQDPTTNCILYEPEATVRCGSGGVLLDLDSADPTGEQVTEATRLSAYTDENGNLYCGTEVVTQVAVCAPGYINGESATEAYLWWDIGHSTAVIDLNNFNATAARDVVLKARLWAYMNAWDKAPHILSAFRINNTGGVRDLAYAWINGSLDNLSIITPSNLRALHEVCVYSQFDSFGAR